jgi:hypothetical protein
MAVETLSPDWEFDRVDDGSQSKGTSRESAGGRCLARCSADGGPTGGLCVAGVAQRPGRDICTPWSERDARCSRTFVVGVPAVAGQAGSVSAGAAVTFLATPTPSARGAASTFLSPGLAWGWAGRAREARSPLSPGTPHPPGPRSSRVLRSPPGALQPPPPRESRSALEPLPPGTPKPPGPLKPSPPLALRRRVFAGSSALGSTRGSGLGSCFGFLFLFFSRKPTFGSLGS